LGDFNDKDSLIVACYMVILNGTRGGYRKGGSKGAIDPPPKILSKIKIL